MSAQGNEGAHPGGGDVWEGPLARGWLVNRQGQGGEKRGENELGGGVHVSKA